MMAAFLAAGSPTYLDDGAPREAALPAAGDSRRGRLPGDAAGSSLPWAPPTVPDVVLRSYEDFEGAHPTATTKYDCALCGIRLAGPGQLEDHMQTKEHKAAARTHQAPPSPDGSWVYILTDSETDDNDATQPFRRRERIGSQHSPRQRPLLEAIADGATCANPRCEFRVNRNPVHGGYCCSVCFKHATGIQCFVPHGPRCAQRRARISGRAPAFSPQRWCSHLPDEVDGPTAHYLHRIRGIDPFDLPSLIAHGRAFNTA